MERRVGAGAWFAAAGGLALMAPLAFVGVGTVTGVQADAGGAAAGIADDARRRHRRRSAGRCSPCSGSRCSTSSWRARCGWCSAPSDRAPPPSPRRSGSPYAAVFVGAIAMLADARRIADGAGAASALGLEGRDAAVLSRLDGFDAAWKAGLVLFGMHLLVIGWLLLRRSGVFATVVGALVLLAGAGYLADSVLWILVPDGLAFAQFTFVGEIVLIAWLVVGGIRSLRDGRASVDPGWSPTAGPPRRTSDRSRLLCSAVHGDDAPFGTGDGDVVRGEGHLGLPGGRDRGQHGVPVPRAAASASSGTPVEQIDYVPAMLWVIGGAIVASIIGRILVEIFSPSESTRGDIRDKEIDRLGERVGSSFVVIGALGALVLAMLDADGFWIANTVYFCFVLSAILSSITKLVAYRRGVPRW